MIKLTLTNFNSVLYCTNWLPGSFSDRLQVAVASLATPDPMGVKSKWPLTTPPGFQRF